jgi:hypothetical protein
MSVQTHTHRERERERERERFCGALHRHHAYLFSNERVIVGTPHPLICLWKDGRTHTHVGGVAIIVCDLHEALA